MSKGEFEKRIKAFRKNTYRLRVFTDEEATMIQNSMILLVEEAKKDFPIWNNRDIEARLTGDVLLDLVKAKDKWATKWFGETL